ncbi:unnamed protein product [Dovyalis caffra]|uniref:Uncharacterized protein n=1 Tax=Dovyalis caffra TaxID=77055 RepID=A0AAV1SKA0_9ROSI|nr:unnamed protein product [Dovyalis caffra]
MKDGKPDKRSSQTFTVVVSCKYAPIRYLGASFQFQKKCSSRRNDGFIELETWD